MDCQTAENLIPEYVDGELQHDESQLVTEHLKGCRACQTELEIHQKTWNLLGDLETIEPSPNYVSRFWTELVSQKSWYEELIGNFKVRRLAPAFVILSLFLIMGIYSVNNFFQVQPSDQTLAQLSETELELIENIELAENFFEIENIDLLMDLEAIESLES